MSQEKNPRDAANITLFYMILVIGLLLIVIGLYLSTYTAVVMVDESTLMSGYTTNIQAAEQIRPYLPMGIIVIVSAVPLISFTLYKTGRTLLLDCAF